MANQHVPTQQDRAEDAARTFWDPITAEVGARSTLLCPYCAVQCPTSNDLIEHTKAAHGVEPVGIEVEDGD